MSKYDKHFIDKQARLFGYQSSSFEKVARLIDVLRFLNETQEMQDNLALKGGTAINLTIFNLPRLSVDIDLDFAQNLTKEETKIKRERIKSVLEQHMTAEGYTKSPKSKETHILDSYVYSYMNTAGNTDNIKVEINYSLRCHVLPTEKITIKTADTFSNFEAHTLSPIEIYASKIVAFDDRAAARDLYDLNNMIYYGLFDEQQLEMLRKCAVFYSAITGDIAEQPFTFNKTDSINYHKIKTDLYPMITNKERFDLEVTKERVTSFLQDFMTLNDSEKSFLHQFGLGKFKPEILFNDPQIIERVSGHPMAVWRTSQQKPSKNLKDKLTEKKEQAAKINANREKPDKPKKSLDEEL